MKQALFKKQHGFSTMGIVVIVGIILVAGVGLIVIVTNSGKKPATSNGSTAAVIKNATCDYSDEELCKFFTIRKKAAPHTLTYITGSGTAQNTMTIQLKDASTYSLKVTGAVPYETVTIGDAYYVRGADGTWWKRSIPADEADKYNPEVHDDLVEPSAKTVLNDRPYYEQQGQEACGNLTCLKYQMTDPSDPGNYTYVWFDTSEYKLRRLQNTGLANPFNATYTYGNVVVNAPTPVKDLAPGQVLPPGQSTPISADQSQQPAPLPDDYEFE
ncbi:MAG TPA: hypothetical protein VLF43_01155 [Candidatus Saccharimonadales bacterium]|nr:hypothetical protein [Candidatus Saccharimonadales bacterium]